MENPTKVFVGPGPAALRQSVAEKSDRLNRSQEARINSQGPAPTAPALGHKKNREKNQAGTQVAGTGQTASH
jgi:hypothetical protein